MQAEEMSIAAQNALLKTLEEPPESAFIILVTRSLDRLLPTTLSRCQPVPFGSLPDDFVEACLSDRHPDLPADHARFLSRYCGGRLGSAIRLAGAGLFEIKVNLNQTLADLRALGPTGFAAVAQEHASSLAETFIAELVEAGKIEKAGEAATTEPTRRGLRELLALASCLYRDVIQLGCGRPDQLINADQADLVGQMADRIDPERAAQAVRDIYRAETDIASNANVPLALETLAIRLLRHETRDASKPLGAAREDTQ
jgi:DNA polymerase-3 subunit delta'